MDWLNALVQGALLGGLYALFACGLSVMFGVMRIVNLAHGDLGVLAAFLAYSVITLTPLGPFWASVVIIPFFALLGYAAQRGLIQHALRVGPLATLLVTFGISVIIQNLLLEGYSADTRSLPAGSLVSASLPVSGGISVSYLAVITFVLAVAVLAGLQFFLSGTALGRMLRATSDDRETAGLVGADTRHIYAVATGIAFAIVALAGLLFAMRSSFDPSIGPTRLIFAFEAVVIGGLGSLWGTLIGGLALGVAQTLGAQVDPAFTLLAGHLVFLGVLAFRPQGLVAGRAA